MNYDLMRKQQEELSEEHLWDMILSYQNITFKTYSGLSFTYECEKEEMVNIQKNFGLTAGKKVKAWPGVR